MSDTSHLLVRLLALALISSIVQLAGVSQITLFGVNADLSPLVVVAAGFLCGSTAGATFGFAVGLFLDLAFVQTLGVSSLILRPSATRPGGCASWRAPEPLLTPLALGAAATAASTIGYAVLEFMLGVKARRSACCWCARSSRRSVLNTIIALPVYALVRRWLTPALPDDPAAGGGGAPTRLAA